MSRQNYYKGRSHRARKEVDEMQVLKFVKRKRRLEPRMGGRKLHLHSQNENQFELGRDRFFDLLRANDLLVPPLPKAPRTTNSRHALPVFMNLTREVEPKKQNEVWVADLTYLRVRETFCYLAIIMDRYSRKIVGYHCGQTLEAVTCQKALERALAMLPEGSYPIHHSDRGSQYCCHKTVELLSNRRLRISMTEENHCYENAHAERVIGTLKQEYGLHGQFKSHQDASRAVEQAIWIYNHHRLHRSLNYRTPQEVHERGLS